VLFSVIKNLPAPRKPWGASVAVAAFRYRSGTAALVFLLHFFDFIFFSNFHHTTLVEISYARKITVRPNPRVVHR